MWRVTWLQLLQVIHAYAHISNVENDTTSVLYPKDTRKLLESYGGTTRGCGVRGSKWLARIARKCIGRRTVCVFPIKFYFNAYPSACLYWDCITLWQVHIPFNVKNMHWHLLVLNFDKEEIQVLNSIPHIRDEAKETSLIECIQSCIKDAVECGLVQTPGPINITKWTKLCYTNIPQQNDGYVLHCN
jgi:hypothetical protein